MRRLALLLLIALVPLLGSTPGASAAPELDPDYTITVANPSRCGMLGSSDSNGVFYAACGARIVRWDRNGTRLADITVPAGGNYPNDVAPSPDGSFLYVSQDFGTPRRYNRTNTGAYVMDPAWRLEPFTVWNATFTPMGRAIATDGRGDIYLSNGSLTTESQRSVVKYRPDGTFVTAFGDWGREPGNWVTNQDLAVTRDGRRVYVGENCGTNCRFGTEGYDASRITRYDFNAGGTYRFTRIISRTGPYGGKTFPDCDAPGAVHSVYSLALDFQENLYATSTTCGRVQKFDTDADPAKDAFVTSVVTWNDQPNRSHYLGVDWAGRVRAFEWDRVFTPRTIELPALPLPPLEPLPTPDTVAPTVTKVTMPATTTNGTVEIAIAATDDRAVTELQLAREDGEWGPWQPFATPVAYELSANYGVKGVYVRVRDIAGNESPAVYTTLSYVEPVAPGDPPPPVNDVAAPVLAEIVVPPLTAARDVQVTLTATDDTGVRHVRFANEDGNFGPWRVFAATSTWTLSENVGVKRVYAQVRDGAGNESAVLSAPTRYALDAPPPAGDDGGAGGGGAPDATAPILTALRLPAETTTQAITAQLEATDAVGVAQVRFANEDGTWTAWQASAAEKPWTLSAGFGAKAVYAQVRDAAGNESVPIMSRTSFVRTLQGPVDAVDPALTAVVLPETVPTAAVTVRLTATDDIGVTHVRLANEDGEWGPWVAFAADVPHQLTAGNTYKVVYAQVRDAVGRESNVLFARTLVAP